MNTDRHSPWTRRDVLRGFSAATSAGLLGLGTGNAAAEPPPETSTIRMIFDPRYPILCYTPQYVAEQFLRIEGFTDVQYVPFGPEVSEAKVLERAEADISAALCPDVVIAIDSGAPIVTLAGLHSGCFELFATEKVRSIRELKNKRVAVTLPEQNFISAIAASIGIDPDDIEWVLAHPNDWTDLLDRGEVDAIGTFPPMNYDLHDRKIGNVILNTATDDPWRSYFCCMVTAREEFVQKYPVATKRALRAIIKANQLCTLEPQRIAQFLVDKGYESSYDYALRTLRDIPYGAWRDYDPEDSVRFYTLRLRDAGMAKKTPQQLISAGTDFRFLNELKKELKA